LGAFLAPFAAVFGTCFVDLELAPPPKMMRWFLKGAAVTLRVYNTF
jgi:hypothetical protein